MGSVPAGHCSQAAGRARQTACLGNLTEHKQKGTEKKSCTNTMQIRFFHTFHPIRIGPRLAWWAGGCVIVIEARVARGAGLSCSTRRQRLSSSHSLQAYLRFNPLIDDLRLKRQRDGGWRNGTEKHVMTHTLGHSWLFNAQWGYFLSPFPHGHMLCGSENSPFWNMEVWPYTQRIPPLWQLGHRKIHIKKKKKNWHKQLLRKRAS